MKSQFETDNEWSLRMQSQYMTVLYRHLVGVDGQFVLVSGTRASLHIQKQGIDALLFKEGKSICVEEKLVRWPKNNQPHSRFALETLKNTSDGGKAFGWMVTGQCDWLVYGFEIQKNGTTTGFDVCFIDFGTLKWWFWETLTRQNRSWSANITDFSNHTMTSLVPVHEVREEVGMWRYWVTEDAVTTKETPRQTKNSHARTRPHRSDYYKKGA